MSTGWCCDINNIPSECKLSQFALLFHQGPLLRFWTSP